MFLHFCKNVLYFNKFICFGSIMKKFLSITALLLLSIFTLTACSTTSLTLSGSYWNKNQTNPTESIYEECVYDVKCVSTTPTDSNEIKNENVSLTIKDSSYKTTLEFINNPATYGEHYVFTTKLLLNGEYKVGSKEPVSFNDSVETITYFKTFLNGYQPILSYRNATSSTYFDSQTGEVISFAYEHKIVYDGDNATLTSKTAKVGKLNEATEKTSPFKKYKSNDAYVENNLLLFIPRAYDYKNAISEEFRVIDAITGDLKTLRYATSSTSEGLDIKTLDGSYSIDGAEAVSYPAAIKIFAYVANTFSGQSLESYYATDHPTHRHRLIKHYSALNNEMGYLEYSLKSVSTTRPNL